jgi:hypothetical protein
MSWWSQNEEKILAEMKEIEEKRRNRKNEQFYSGPT